MSLITPRTLKGFRDYPPQLMRPREALIDIAKRVYRSFGYQPIDTPALEYLEILTGKGSEETDRIMYRFEDHGGRMVGMRFDLTVPLARFAAQNAPELGVPFKRYHIGPVWRGENTGRGRYREFVQCDFDTIGTESIVADIETTLVIYDLFQAIGLPDITVCVNNRKVLTGLLDNLSLGEKSTEILRSLDKLAKIGREKVAAEMMETAGASPQQADEVLKLADITGESSEVLSQLDSLVGDNEIGSAGVRQLRTLVEGAAAGGMPSECLKIDVSIARGLDYYTGTVFETFLKELPDIGSVCSGGRYDNLAGVYTKQHLPGIGASLGLDRLIAGLEELGRIEDLASQRTVFIPYFDEQRLGNYLHIAAQLRTAGFDVEVYPEAKRLGQQLKYADRHRFPVAMIAGQNEFAAGKVQIKDLRAKSTEEVPLEEDAASLIARLRQLLDEPLVT